MAEVGIAALVLTVIVQGGFFAKVYILATILLLVGIFLQLVEKRRVDKKIWPLWGLLIILYIMSSFYHGLQTKEWDKVIYIFSIGVMHFYFCHLNKKERQRLQRALIGIGVLECIMGVLVYAGLPIAGIIMNMRFMGTFQYANATALFFGILLILQTDTETFRQTDVLGFRILFTVFLQLTFSFGGMICYFIGVMVLAKKNRSSLFQYAQEFVISGVFSGSIFVAKFYLNKNQFLVRVILLLLLVACFCSAGFWSEFKEKTKEKIWLKITIMGMLLADGIACFYRFGGRAKGTAWERIQQMKDGILILEKNWWLGIGAHRLLGILQSIGVSYKTTLVHNSYIQIGIEAGIFAVGIVLLLILQWWRSIERLENSDIYLWRISVMAMVLFHFMIDISFFFWAIMCMFMLCVTGMEDVEGRLKR